MAQPTAIEVAPQPQALARVEDIGISIEQIVARVDKIRLVRDKVMKHDVHYGKIPGVKKESLFKPGAETLCMAFQLAPKFHVDERWDGEHLEAVITCTLVHVPTGTELGDGLGSCSTRESKYAFRKGERLCPKCSKPAIIKGQEQFGGGWVCWKKKDGCGAKFKDGDEEIESQKTDRVPNPDIADVYNTVRKMACKRAHVAATLFVTGASELFTQDVEDMPRARDDVPDEGSDGTPPVGAAPSKPQVVATDKDLADVVALIRGTVSTTELQAISKAHKNRKWSRTQREALMAAYTKRDGELRSMANDANEDAEAFGGAS